MDLIVDMRFGSHLYGTATPESDLDCKAVCLPGARDILLQRVQGTMAFVAMADSGRSDLVNVVITENAPTRSASWC